MQGKCILGICVAALLLALSATPALSQELKFGEEIKLGTVRLCGRMPHVAIGFLQAGKELVVADEEGVRVFDVKTGAVLRTLAIDDSICSASIAGTTIAMATGYYPRSQVQVWDLAKGTKLTSFTSHKGYSLRACLSPDGKFLAVSGLDKVRTEWGPELSANDRSIRLWDLASGQELPAFSKGLKTGLRMAFSPDSKQLA